MSHTCTHNNPTWNLFTHGWWRRKTEEDDETTTRDLEESLSRAASAKYAEDLIFLLAGRESKWLFSLPAIKKCKEKKAQIKLEWSLGVRPHRRQIVLKTVSYNITLYEVWVQ